MTPWDVALIGAGGFAAGAVNAVAGALNAAVLHADADQWLLAARTSDFREAMTAFREKRPGVFTGD